MIWLWRYLFGYLTISLCGENAEKVLNVAAKNNINIWDLKCNKGKITGNIGIKNFKKLRTLKRKIKCKVKIIKKIGLPFRIKRYINRTGFFIGIIIFAVIILCLSNFVWVINIEGNSTLSKSIILDSCEKIGIKVGIIKNKVDTKYDSQRLLLKQKGSAWGSFNLEGCVLTLNLTETAVTDKEERESPSNIKAAVNGKIKKIDVSSGDVLVKVGDTVSKGEILVSGIIKNLSSTMFVHSNGEIIANTERTFSSSGNFVQQIKAETGKVKKRYTVEIFNLKIPLFLGSVKDDYIYSCKIKNLKLFDNKIPINVAIETYTVIQEKTVEYDMAKLEELLFDEIKNQIEELNFISAEEINRESILTNEGILLKVTYNCEENIAKQDEILLNDEN